MIAAMLEHHAHRTVANLRRISIRSFLRHSSTFSSCGASGNPGAVQSRRQAVAIALSESGTSNRQSKQQNQRQYARTKSKERHGQTAQQRKQGHSLTRQGRTQAE